NLARAAAVEQELAAGVASSPASTASSPPAAGQGAPRSSTCDGYLPDEIQKRSRSKYLPTPAMAAFPKRTDAKATFMRLALRLSLIALLLYVVFSSIRQRIARH